MKTWSTHYRLAPPEFDRSRLQDHRLGRLRSVMAERDVDVIVLVDPLSLRYALDVREYTLFQSRIPTLYAFVPREGPVALHAASGREYRQVDRYLPPRRLSTFYGGLELSGHARGLADDLRAWMRECGADERRLRVAVELLSPSATQALEAAGFDVVDGTGCVERARSVKSEEELVCMRHAIRVAESAMVEMHAVLEPGIRECELWSVLQQVNAAHDGDWCDGRMLASGPRTNPWLQETSDRVIQAGELMAFDTDMIGPNGYCADISRTWLCGHGRPSAKQLDLHARAMDEVSHNAALLRAGLGFREFAERAFRQPDRFIAQRYPCVAHGVGMSDEWPKVSYMTDWNADGYDGEFETDMVICIESYVGAEGETEGVKLEQMMRVTDTGAELLTHAPLDLRFGTGG